ncbi:MAG: iron chelate uptake ABC transporter family permease subunit [Delftia acidovorans]|nr:iron chelate uptake ABC transporter family permease subunit [Delftia acidovorans]
MLHVGRRALVEDVLDDPAALRRYPGPGGRHAGRSRRRHRRHADRRPVLSAVALTAIATAAAGPIAFVALAGPQLARRLTRSPEVPVVSAALMGMVLLMMADLISQRFPLNLSLPIGSTTGLLGGAYLLWLLTRSRTV